MGRGILAPGAVYVVAEGLEQLSYSGAGKEGRYGIGMEVAEDAYAFIQAFC